MEIGGFITSGAEIVNHDNTLSGNGTVDSPLRLNETVLWEGTPGSSTGNISEAITNFERIRFYWHYHENGSSVQSPCIVEIPVISDNTRYFLNITFGATNCYIVALRIDFSNSYATFTVQSGSGVVISSWGGGGTVSSVPSATITNCVKGIFRIVGINRIANN